MATLRDELQQKCCDMGLSWRASDAHGVDLTIEQAAELLRDALGVEVDIKLPAASGEPVAFDTEGFRAFVLRELPDDTIIGKGEWWADHLTKCMQWFVKPTAAPQPAPAPARVPLPMMWYDGAPPFPQDQEWFIAETIHGDRVVLRSLDEGREHKHTYDFKTADGTYMATRFIKRWMQFPYCEYLPPAAATPAQGEPK